METAALKLRLSGAAARADRRGAGVLGYYTYLTARQFERLGEQSIAESSLLLLQDKVERIEQQIIAARQPGVRADRLDDPDGSVQRWQPRAEELSPSVRALLVLDGQRDIFGYAARATAPRPARVPQAVHEAHARATSSSRSSSRTG